MMKANQINISRELIDTYMWYVERYLMKQYGSTQASIEIDPLRWYIVTGRAPVQFIRLMIQKKPYLIARILHKKGESYNEIIDNIKKYIGFKEV